MYKGKKTCGKSLTNKKTELIMDVTLHKHNLCKQHSKIEGGPVTRKIDEELIKRVPSVSGEKKERECLEFDERVIFVDKFISIERRFMSRLYASDILDEEEWHKVMHFQLFGDFKFGSTFVGHKSFKEFYKCSPKSYKRICKNLEKKGFIKQDAMADRIDKSDKNKLTVTKVLLSPLYDPETKTIIPKNITKTNRSIDFMAEHYAIVPRECLEKLLEDERLSVDCKKLLIFLYRFNCYNLFTGVDPNLISKVGNEIYIHPRLTDSLQLSPRQTEKAMNLLEACGFIFWNTVFIYEEFFDIDCRLRVSTTQLENSWEAKIITPAYQRKGGIA